MTRLGTAPTEQQDDMVLSARRLGAELIAPVPYNTPAPGDIEGVVAPVTSIS